MARLEIELPDELAEVVCQRADALGTSSDQWVSLMLTDIVADIPEDRSGPDEWIGR